MDNQMTTAAACLEIDLGALRWNIRLLQAKVGPACRVAGVVKADAYGIGLRQVAQEHRACGTDTFFVATLDEGISLRGMVGKGPEIAVLGGLFHGAEGEYPRHNLIPVLNALEDFPRWQRPDPVMIHFDTGMRRLGLDTREAERFVADPSLAKGLNVTAILSHFACADETGHPLTVEQYRKFAALAALFPAARKSLSNSAGIFLSRDYDFDLVRPGMAVYGLNPTPGQPNPMRPVVQLKARVLQVRQALAGESVGYSATHRCDASQRVATIAIGYADGFLRSLSSRGQVFWNGQALPILGRVSMDLVTIDAGGAPDLKAGDWVEILGPHQDADALAAQAGTIGYEILTDLGRRYQRTWIDAKTFETKAVSG